MIDNPEAIRYVNEKVRPLSEKMVQLEVLMRDVIKDWNDTFSVIIGTNPTDDIVDGREDEGVSRLTAADIAVLGVEIQYILTRWDSATMTKIRKPAVRGVMLGNS